jgi:hypothetical protein
MHRLSILLTFCVTISFAQNSNANKTITETDSLVDLFPLSIGNEWTYNYSLDSYDEIAWSYKSSGTVILQIIGKTIMTDSIIWNVQRTNDLNINQNGNLYQDTSISTFNLIEINSAYHRVLSSGFPFYWMPFDSTLINRNAVADSSGIWSLVIDKGRMKYTYTFKQAIGATSYSAMDMCLCLDYWYESYSLSSSHITSVETHRDMNHIKEFRLEQNYPNPFNPSTTISFNLPSRSFVSLKVFDLIGREVATIISEDMQVGNYSRQWNASGFPSGTYFYRLQVGSFAETKKLILLR